MGIRFLCDSCGKKLNIKEELAGKKGRCPKCDSVIKIPKESTLGRSKETAAVASEPAESTLATPVADPQESTTPADIESRPSVHSDLDQQSSNHQELNTTSPSQTADEQVENEAPSGNNDPKDDIVIIPPDPKPPAPSAPSDVLAEEPNAKWYVRPSSGGQFGPAEADVMRSWLEEGRIGRDSLVWREGWEEWQSATETFANELGDSSSPNIPDPPESKKSSDIGESPHNRVFYHRQSRQRARLMGIILVVGLALVSIALAVVLVVVVNNAGQPNEEDKKEGEQSETAKVIPESDRPANYVAVVPSTWERLAA